MPKTRAALILFLTILVFLGLSALLVKRRGGQAALSGPSAPARAAEAPSPAPAPPGPVPPAEALAAVIVDDFGNNLEPLRALCSIGRPVTAAILPYAPLTRESADLAAGCGVEIMLHLPLESLVPKENSAGRISSGMGPEEVRARVLACIDQVPGARGVNNHEGSRTTGDMVVMPEILAALKERGLYFIDSLTAPGSIAFKTARRLGVPAAERRVFLDGDPDEEAVRARLVELFRAARARGRAVGIGHARRETIAALARYLGLAADYGVTLVPASRLVE